MEQLKLFYSQLKDMFLGMTPGNRITVALLLMGLLVSLGFLVIGLPGSSGEYVAAYNGFYFDHPKQITIGNSLSKANLTDYEWKEGKLFVPKKDLSKYIAAISEANIIVEFGRHLQQVVNDFSAFETGKMMDQKIKRAIALEVANVLRQYSWISDASVISDSRSERRTDLYDKKIVNSVAVTIWPHSEKPLTEDQRSAITAQVKTAFGITDLNEIRITDGNNGIAYMGSEERLRGGTKNYEDMQKHYQEEWEHKLKELFPDISGLIVKTYVELDPTITRTGHEVVHGKPTVVSDRERTTSLDKKGHDIAGRPGFVPQQGVPLPNTGLQMISGDTVKEETEEAERNRALQGRESQYRDSGLIPKTISAAIRVPASHIKKVWMDRNTMPGEQASEPTAADLALLQTEIFETIRQSAAKLMEPLRPTDEVDSTQMVHVSLLTDSKPVVEAEMTFAQMLMMWLGANWETLSLLGLVLVGMGVLWSMTRVRQPAPIVIYEAAELPLEEVPLSDEELAALEAEEGVTRSLEPFSKSIISLQSEVADLVNENPDAAASVLRQWIGNVAFQE